MSYKSDLHDIPVFLHRETQKAFLVSTHTTKDPVWVPRSLCEIEEAHDGNYTLTAPEWILTEKELV